MSQARIDLQKRLSAFAGALKTDAITTKTLADVEHNASAQILRNGLAVIGFAMMEDFIRNRTGEILDRAGSGQTRFTELPQVLQNAAVVEIYKSVQMQAKLQQLDSNQRIVLFQDIAKHIVSTQTAAFHLPRWSFGFDQSNLSDSTIDTILSAFWCKDGWQSMKTVASRCGVGIPDLKSTFKAAASRRHSAAHNSSASVEFSDLDSFKNEIIAISMCFDLIISLGLRRTLDRDNKVVVNGNPLAGGHVKVRFIEVEGGKFKERLPNKPRAIKSSNTLEDALNQAYPRAKQAEEAIIIRPSGGFPTAWTTPYID
ncbi:MAE_28990/MAE_18760 family HEPN-like nuclease [Deinococcus ficus]|uniref:MAE_28990/MAE_18760 family HEPN-like nuclease n=1 Tax=Deinococcus ficus TaxID=317577 RepID=UPI00131AFB78|nr:MAE_28990/MAE_18760 family HEPN-like nuclease [Deinococcus ficus]